MELLGPLTKKRTGMSQYKKRGRHKKNRRFFFQEGMRRRNDCRKLFEKVDRRELRRALFLLSRQTAQF